MSNTKNLNPRSSKSRWISAKTRYETWKILKTYKAICDTNRKPCLPSKIRSQDHESKISVKKKTYIAWYLYWNVPLALQVAENCPPSHFFHLVSIPFQWLFWKNALAWHLLNRTKVSQVSNTTGTPLDSILFHRFEAWSHRPPCQAPGLGSFIANFIPFQVEVRNGHVHFQCFGKVLWTKMGNHMKPEKSWKLTRRSATLTESHVYHQKFEAKITGRRFPSKKNIYIAWYLYWNVPLALQVPVAENCPPSHFFHLVSIPFQWLFWKDAQAWHLLNRTKVSQVSNNTGTPLDSILFHRFEAWSHKPPVPCTRPWLLQCPWNWIPSRRPSRSCWPSMLRPGPGDKNDVRLN